MRIKTITTDELRRMSGEEALILQGCGGSLQEWVDGINDLLTREGILLEGTKFSGCSTFEHDGLTCLIFPFKDDVKLNMGKLAMWRLATHGNFGGTWLSDFVQNQLGGFEQEAPVPREKPDCPLIGQDGNIFNLVGIAARTLRENGMSDAATEMTDRCYQSDSYSEALNVIGEYVNITGPEETLDEEEGMGMQQ